MVRVPPLLVAAVLAGTVGFVSFEVLPSPWSWIVMVPASLLIGVWSAGARW